MYFVDWRERDRAFGRNSECPFKDIAEMLSYKAPSSLLLEMLVGHRGIPASEKRGLLVWLVQKFEVAPGVTVTDLLGSQPEYLAAIAAADHAAKSGDIDNLAAAHAAARTSTSKWKWLAGGGKPQKDDPDIEHLNKVLGREPSPKGDAVAMYHAACAAQWTATPPDREATDGWSHPFWAVTSIAAYLGGSQESHFIRMRRQLVAHVFIRMRRRLVAHAH